ncbi:Zinc finger CCCH domain-containing protein 65 [Triticum urartu]|uniref:Zinc finger CCCH domain-containing protein 65 n=1 Tax=Triticum urartu TaxID=4572 RepID=M7ZGS8_TRIUA|nr:Zinc finger CCCH domain-containing protein 65 [Triticum urartu]
MADADAKAPPKSNLDADLIASISPSSNSSGARNAVAIESQFADLAISDELPKPSGWGDDAVLGIAGSDEITGEITGGKVQPVATADSRPRFPQRHAEPDCTYYLKFGTCRFGMKCKFNHPARKKKNRVKASGSSSSGSNDISNKAFPPDDDQVVEEISFETVEVVGWSKGCLMDYILELILVDINIVDDVGNADQIEK